MSQEAQQPIFSLDKIYIKDVSIEVPNAPKIFLKRGQPSIELNLNFNTINIDNEIYETTIHAVVDAKLENEQMFLIEIDQAAIFQIKNVQLEHMEILYNVECPTLIFPYLREAVSDLTTRAGFLPVVLTPVNFAYLYQQKKQAEKSKINSTIN